MIIILLIYILLIILDEIPSYIFLINVRTIVYSRSEVANVCGYNFLIRCRIDTQHSTYRNLLNPTMGETIANHKLYELHH